MSEEVQVQEIETRAKRMGWTPEEEFKGDPGKWLSAEDFVKRAETELPIALGTIKTLERKLGRMEERIERQSKTFEQFNEYHKGALQKEFERGLAAAKAKMRAAAEVGDTDAYDAAEKEAETLLKNKPEIPGPEKGTSTLDQDITDKWVADNIWIKENPRMGKYAFECGEFLARTKPKLSQQEQLDEIRAMVEEEFPAYFEKEENGNPNRKRRSAVESGGREAAPSSGKKRGYHDLPPEAQQMCDNFCAEIKGFTKEDYLKTYAGPWRS